MSHQFRNMKINDEYYTPANAVVPILKYLKPNSTIWCPFDKHWSEYVKVLRANGHIVIHTHIDDGQDFLTFEPFFDYDYIISNPPYSINRDIMDKLMRIDKPFALLIGNQALTIRGYMSKWNKYHRNLQLILFENKVFFRNGIAKPSHYKKAGTYFHTFYFCNGWLPKDLILDVIEKNK